ncbi:hypothetical protein [Mesonia aestuariivivens]|nr:hypothetical protein [Mesonia aestuariivivens]
MITYTSIIISAIAMSFALTTQALAIKTVTSKSGAIIGYTKNSG